LHAKSYEMKDLFPKIINTLTFCLVFVFSLAVYSSSIYAQDCPKREVRAVWLTTIGGLDWPHSYAQSSYSAKKQQKELCDILDKLKSANVNTVLLQTRIRGTVIYPSQYEPWDGCLSGFPGKSPGYDALQFAIDECHKRGMELHAWVVTMPIGKWNKLGAANLRKKHPELCKKVDDEGYMMPEKSGTAKYIASICREIAENYDVDGIHLDYIRYPETYPMRGSADTRRANITNIVKCINEQVKSIKPWIKMSCSPIGKYSDLARYWSHGWNAYETVCQDAQGWLRDGLMDQLYPMMYFQGEQFYPFAIDWQERSYGRTIAPGLGIYFMSDKEKNWDSEIIRREMNVLRTFGLGHAYFRSKFFTDNLKGIYDFATDDIDRYPALVPAMTWASSTLPSAPSFINVINTDTADIIRWGNGTDHSGSPYLSYNLYASVDYPVNTENPCNLIATKVAGNAIALKSQDMLGQLNYAVTSIDRYGNESRPAFLKPVAHITHAKLLKNDGNTLQVPTKPSVLDADYVVITSIAGTITAMRPYTGTAIDIKELSNGFYTVSSINAKGVTHKLGNFIKKK
jgi:uncharacterized lipoprotein YddW (UPF0748 family)